MKPVNKTVCSLAALAPLAMAQSANAGQRPNIIFFLVDDFGWTETSLPFGEETYPNNLRFHTPNMERLARTGVMMTNAYACPVSTPTRTSMMTGMNAAHMGITSYCSLYKDTCPDAIGGRPGTTNANEDDIFAHPEWNYNALCPASFRNEADSIAYGLNRTLYATPMVEILRDAGYHTIHVGKAHWAPTGTPGSNPYNMGFTVNIAGSGNGHPQSYLPEEHFGNLPKRGTYASVQNMSQYYGSGIHLTEALTLEALKTLEDPIRRKQPFYLYFAHYSNHTPIQRDERFIRKYLDAGMDEQQARYASMVEGMDKSLGDVLDYLEAKGIADDTIILFMSDNGGHCLGQDKGGEPHTQNLPLREGKASVYEGGIRVPLIFRWPGKAAEGTRLNTPVINEDIFPTILEMAGVKHYETVQECDGLSLARLITAGSKMVAKAQKRGEIATRKEVNAVGFRLIFDKVDVQAAAEKFRHRLLNEFVVDRLFRLVFVGRDGRKAVRDEDQAVLHVLKADLALALLVLALLLDVGVDGRGEGALRGLFRRAAVLQPGRVVVVFNVIDAVGKAERRRDLHLILRLIRAVAAAALGLDERRDGQCVLPGQLLNVVEDAVGIAVVRRLKRAAALHAQAERHAAVDHSLPVQHVLKIALGHVDVREHLQIRPPADGRASLFAVGRGALEPADDLAVAKMQGVFLPVAPDGHIHVFRGVLRGARAEAVEAERVLVVFALVVFILAAGVHFAEDQLPVVALLLLVPVHRTAAPEILHLNGLVFVARNGYNIAESLARLVDRVRKNFKHRVLAALQPVRAEDDAGAFAHALRALEHRDAVIAVSRCWGLCHVVGSLSYHKMW